MVTNHVVTFANGAFTKSRFKMPLPALWTPEIVRSGIWDCWVSEMICSTADRIPTLVSLLNSLSYPVA